jgi:hypothetical protein
VQGTKNADGTVTATSVVIGGAPPGGHGPGGPPPHGTKGAPPSGTRDAPPAGVPAA